MLNKQISMYFSLFKHSSKYEDLQGFYFLYIILNLIALMSPLGIVFIYLGLIVGMVMPIFFSPDSIYKSPMTFNELGYPNAFVLENSLPIGRKNFLIGRIKYTFITGIIYAVSQLPSFIVFFIIRLKESTFELRPIFHLSIFFSIIILTILLNILGYISQIASIKKHSLEKLRKQKKNAWVIGLIYGFMFQFLRRPLNIMEDWLLRFIPTFRSGYIFAGILTTLILVILIRFVIDTYKVFSDIHKIDFLN